jgi:hypothetical protein
MTFKVVIPCTLVKLGRNLMALRARPIFILTTWYRLQGVGFVDYKHLQSGDRSVLPAISRTKTLPFLEYLYCTVALSKVGNRSKPCGRW